MLLLLNKSESYENTRLSSRTLLKSIHELTIFILIKFVKYYGHLLLLPILSFLHFLTYIA